MDTPVLLGIMATLLGTGGIAGLIAFRKAPSEIAEVNIQASRVTVASAGELVGLQRGELQRLHDEVTKLRADVTRLTHELADATRRNAELEARLARLGG